MAYPGAKVIADLRQVAASILGPRRPEPGERACGQGASGAIVAVAEQQPLAADGIWRISLAGEPFGRMVGPARDGAWLLLRVDDLTASQCDAYEASMSECGWHQMAADSVSAA